MSKHAPRGRLKAVDDPLVTPNPLEGHCMARSKRSGVRCKRFAIVGGTVCIMHGGGAPQVKQKALERLQAFQDRAISRLFELSEQKEYPSTSLSAVKDVLDRTMGKPVETQHVTVAGDAETLAKILAAARRVPGAVIPPEVDAA